MNNIDKELPQLSDLQFKILYRKIEVAKFINDTIRKGVPAEDIATALNIDVDRLNLYRRGAAEITIKEIATIEFMNADHVVKMKEQ